MEEKFYHHGYLSSVTYKFERLLKDGSNQKRIEEIYAFLKKVTAEDFGYDAEAWRGWLRKTDWDTARKGTRALREQEEQAKKTDKNEASEEGDE